MSPPPSGYSSSSSTTSSRPPLSPSSPSCRPNYQRRHAGLPPYSETNNSYPTPPPSATPSVSSSPRLDYSSKIGSTTSSRDHRTHIITRDSGDSYFPLTHTIVTPQRSRASSRSGSYSDSHYTTGGSNCSSTRDSERGLHRGSRNRSKSRGARGRKEYISTDSGSTDMVTKGIGMLAVAICAHSLWSRSHPSKPKPDQSRSSHSQSSHSDRSRHKHGSGVREYRGEARREERRYVETPSLSIRSRPAFESRSVTSDGRSDRRYVETRSQSQGRREERGKVTYYH